MGDGILSHGIRECLGVPFFCVVLSLFLCVVWCNVSTVVCGYVLTTTVSTLSVAVVYLLVVCFLEARLLLVEGVAVAALTDVVEMFDENDKKNRDGKIDQCSQMREVSSLSQEATKEGEVRSLTWESEDPDEVHTCGLHVPTRPLSK